MNWKEFERSSLEQIFSWAEDQTWCQAMTACNQDSQWHAEGDVWTHTKMVCQNLTNMQPFQSLEPVEQSILLAAALFHDVSKPETTQIDPLTGKITSPKHAVKGEFLSRKILRDMNCNLETRNHISFLVRNHGKPVFLHNKTIPENEVIRTSITLDNFLLFLLATADFLGRNNLTNDRKIEDLQYWDLLSAELNCKRESFSFPNRHARFLFGQQLNDDRFYVPHQDFSCTVTLMCGLPGSGKDTWIQKNRSNLPVVSLDEIRRNQGIDPTENQGTVVQLAKEHCKEFLREKVSFILNATNTTTQTRGRWISLFHNYGAEIEIAYLEPPLKLIQNQNSQRSDCVPASVIQKLADSFQPPTLLECHKLIQFEH